MYAKCIINHTVRQRQRERVCVQNVTAVYTVRRLALGPLAFRRAEAMEEGGGVNWGSRKALTEFWTYRIPFIGLWVV